MNRLLRRAWTRLLGTFASRTEDDDLAAELESHIQLLADENIRRGFPADEAWRRARLQFGNVESIKQRYREQRGLPLVETTWQDLTYAIRVNRKRPGFAIVAILSLAIGIGANTAMFSLVNGVLLRPLGYDDPDRLFAARTTIWIDGRRVWPVNPVHAFEWASQCPSIEAVAVLRPSRAQIAAGTEPATLSGARVSSNFFAVLGLEPILGRTFVAAETEGGRDRVVILTESMWRARFNSDPSVLGASISVDGVDHEVVGVVAGPFWRALARGLQSTASDARFEVFRPLVLEPEERARVAGNYNYAAIVRLKAGASSEQAVAEMNVVQARFPRPTGADRSLEALLLPLHEVVTGRPLGFWMLTAAVGAVLLIVCINLANLLLSRMSARGREAAIRSALGASRGRQLRLALTESLLLAVVGGALGVLLATWLVNVLVTAVPVDLPRLGEVDLDPGVFAFATVLTLLTGVIFGSLPAWRLTRSDPQEALRAGSHTVTEGRRGLRTREVLIAAEVSLSAALLIIAGLLTASLDRLLDADKGFEIEHVLTFDLDTAGPRYEDADARSRFFDRVLAKVAAVPGVEDSGIVTELPLEGNTWNDPIYLEENGIRSERHPVENRFASPGLFRALNIRVVHGRSFEERDRGQSVAILSQRAARLLWPDDDNPVGRRFMGEDDATKILVGVVADVRASIQENPSPHAYYPYWQRVPGDVAVVIRTRSSPDVIAGPLRTAVRSEDASLPIPQLRSMQDLVDGSVEQRRFQSILVVVFAVSAVLVAGLGIYGVVAYSISRRRTEIGIRLALGARRMQLVRMLVVRGMIPVLAGLAIGLAAALLAGRTIRTLLFEIEPADPAIIAGVAIVLLTVGVWACLIPARRATVSTTLDVLRFE